MWYSQLPPSQLNHLEDEKDCALFWWENDQIPGGSFAKDHPRDRDRESHSCDGLSYKRVTKYIDKERK